MYVNRKTKKYSILLAKFGEQLLRILAKNFNPRKFELSLHSNTVMCGSITSRITFIDTNMMIKYNNLPLLTAFAATFLLFACNPQQEAPILLKQAQSLVESHPDSTLRLLDAIFYPEKALSEREYMSYIVTWVQTRHKANLPIHADTLIFVARAYFSQHDNDPRQTALAYFHSGNVYREQGNFDNTMLNYLQAAQHAERTGDADLQSLIHHNIGDLLAKQGLHSQALDEYKKAKYYLRQSPNQSEEKQANVLSAIGNMYLLLGKYDNSFTSLYEGLEFAKLSGNNNVQSLLLQNLSLVYTEIQEYEIAEKYLRQAFELNDDDSELSRFYLNFARLFLITNQTDLLHTYIDKLRQTIEYSGDLYFKTAAYGFLADNAKARGNFDAAFYFLREQNLSIEEIAERRLDETIYEVLQRYNYEKEMNRFRHQINIYQRWIIVMLSLLLIVGFVIAKTRIRHKNKLLEMNSEIITLKNMAQEQSALYKEDITQKEEKLQEMHTEIASWQQKSKELTALQKETLRKRTEGLRSLIFYQLDLKDKVAELKKLRTGKGAEEKLLKRFQEIMYGKNQGDKWGQTESIFERINDKTPQKLRRLYPDLNDTEYRVALLSYAGITVGEIAIILYLSEKTVQNNRNKLRKKIGITDADTDTGTYLRERLV
jgi:tetratricopeptide (TPR) repeat protein